MENPSLNYEPDYEDPIRSPEEDDKKTKEQEEPKKQDNLTDDENRRIKNKEATPEDIQKERKEQANKAQNLLQRYLKTKTLSPKEHGIFQKEIEEEKSPSRIAKIIEKIQNLAQTKEIENRELPLAHPKLKELKTKFERTCEQNEKYLGTKQVYPFKKWYNQEITKNPTIAHAKELQTRLEGKKIQDKNGLAPRIREYKQLQTLFKKYGIEDPTQNQYIKEEGLSERIQFKQQLKKLESHFNKVKDTGFYSEKMISKTMQESLKKGTPKTVDAQLQEAKQIAKKESENFIYLQDTVNIKGNTIKKMSDSSKDALMKYYKNANLKERKETNWKKLVEHEGALAKELEKIFTTDEKTLQLVIPEFSQMDFLEKKQALKDYQKLLESNLNETEKTTKLIQRGAEKHINKANSQGYLSNKTTKRYIEFFKEDNNFKDKDEKPGNTEKMQETYKKLISPQPDEKYKNLSAYKKRFDKFQKDLAILEEVKTPQEIEKMKKNFNEAGWTKREQLQKDLTKELKNSQKLRKTTKEIKEEEKTEINENMSIKEAIDKASNLIKDGKPRDALKMLTEYDEKNPGNKKILFWMKTALEALAKFGQEEESKNNQEATDNDAQIAQEINKATDNEEIANAMEQVQIIDKNIEGAEQSENIHKGTTDTRERARKESIAQANTEETTELTEDFYNREDNQDVILGDDRTGQEIQQIKLGEKMTENTQLNLKNTTKNQEERLRNKKGTTVTQLTDKNGKTIDAKTARNTQTEEQEKLADKIVKKASQDRQNRGNTVFDLTKRIEAKRAAKKAIETQNQESLRKTS